MAEIQKMMKNHFEQLHSFLKGLPYGLGSIQVAF